MVSRSVLANFTPKFQLADQAVLKSRRSNEHVSGHSYMPAFGSGRPMRKVETGDSDRQPLETIGSAFATENAVKSVFKILMPMFTHQLSVFLHGHIQMYTGPYRKICQRSTLLR